MDGMHEGYHTEDWQNGWEAFPSEPARPEADPWEGSFLPLTHHARKRMQQRRIDLDMVELVIQFGREVCTRGALIFAIGRNEIATAAKSGNNLQHLDGVHVVTSHDDGSVLTVYRNRDLGNLKTNLGFGKRWRQKKWGKNAPPCLRTL